MWEKIKEIINQEGGKCIVIDADQSVYSIKKVDGKQAEEEKEVEKVNQTITDWQAKEKEKEAEEFSQKVEEVRIEDLPL